jgi:hypothetical protein
MFPKHWELERIIRHAFAEILTNQKLIISNQEKQMAAIDDLNAAVTQLTTDVDALIAAQGTPDSAIEPVVANVNALDAQVKAALPAAPVAAVKPATKTVEN